MFRWSRIARCTAAAVVLSAALPLTAAAQPPPSHSLGVFFDAAGSEAVRYGVVPFVPFNFYVIAFDVPGGMQEYEFSLQLYPGMFITGGRQLPAGAVDSAPGDDNWIVATGGACVGASGPFVVVTYAGALFLTAPPNDMPLCIAGATPSRFPGGEPGYVECGPQGSLQPFTPAYNGCAVLNPTIYYPCDPPLYSDTIAVGNGGTSGGTPISLPVRYVPDAPICMSSVSTLGFRIAHAEIDFSWDPSVAMLVDARWAGGPFAAPVVDVVADAGTARVTLDHPNGMCSIYTDTQLLWLDFVAAPHAGQTSVVADRAELVLDNGLPLQPPAQFTAGSLVVGPVADAVESFGARKARWSGRP